MELKKAIIRNFGTISNKTYDFTSGINSYIDNNGKGKSTLAYFIKAMLYGLDNVKVNSSEFKDRKHYEPFNGGSFGGTLEFVHNGHYYHIERTFDSKSNSKDEIKIIIDKEEEKEKYNQEIGERLLNLDKEAFERLLFITSEDIKMESNGNIKKNLNNIINDTAEGVDYDAIVSKLDELDKSYTKKGGVAGVRANMLAAEIEYQKKNYEAAVEYWENAAAKDVKAYTSSLALYNAGVCYEALNQLEDAEDSYKLAADDEDFLLRSHALFSYGRVLETTGKYKEAVEAYQELNSKYPDDGWANLAKTRIIELKLEGKAE